VGQAKQNKTFRTNFEIKEISEEGTFSGYGSVFDVKDRGGDVVLKGAFAKSIDDYKESGTMPPVLWQHSPNEPIGVWTSMKEDDYGLYLEGRLAITIPEGHKARELMKMKAVTGLSIGYSLREGGYEYDKSKDVFLLKDIELWEVSLVTFPMNPEARVGNVKNLLAAGKMPTEREFEKFLKQSGFSDSQSKVIVSRGFKALSHREDAEGAADRDDPEVVELLKQLEQRISIA
jgi:HK97 family phage prohead protease